MPNKQPGKATGNQQAPAPSGAKRSFTSVRLASVVGIVAIAIGAAAYFVSENDVPVQSGVQTQTAPVPAPAQEAVPALTEAPPAPPLAAQQSVEPLPPVALKPHPQANLPPLPFGAAPARPIEVVRAVYQFAAEHPEVLSYVPCYCGCERQGHRGSEDCFVTRRDAKGDVQEWEPHGMT